MDNKENNIDTKIDKLKNGQIIEIKIEKIVFGGEGLGKYNDMAIFVPMSVPGDILEVKIISLKKNYGRALIERVITPSEERVTEGNNITFEDFHGCDFGMLKYSSQLKYKTEMVIDVLERIGKVSDYKLEEIIGAENPFNYRNKVIEPIARVKGEVISGFFKKRSHEIFSVEENKLQTPLANKIIASLKKMLQVERIDIYKEKTHRGVVRNIMIRTNSFNEAMVVLIVKGKPDKYIKNIMKNLSRLHSEIKSTYISINNKRTNFALGDQLVHVIGEKTIKEELFGINFNISPTSFFQINIDQTKKLYTRALEYFGDMDSKVVVDAYSGTGTLAMILASKAKKVYAVEIEESATIDSIATASENKFTNIDFINGDVSEKLVSLLEEGNSIDGIIFDPPRKGIAETVLRKVAEAGIKEMVYISCNPSSFARDIEILTKLGYELTDITPVDMFPQTNHIEVVGKLVLKIK